MGNATLFGALGVFAIYLANVMTGAAGGSVFLSDRVEMLTLFLACILFVVAVLLRERSENQRADPPEETDTKEGIKA